MRIVDADVIKAKLIEYIGLTNGFDRAFNETPTIDAVEVVHGEWISLHNGKWKCSECGIEVLIYAKGNFCPNCGAKMKVRCEDESVDSN